MGKIIEDLQKRKSAKNVAKTGVVPYQHYQKFSSNLNKMGIAQSAGAVELLLCW